MWGFTKQEIYIIIFLVFSLFVGVSVKIYKHFFEDKKLAELSPQYIHDFEQRTATIDSIAVISQRLGDNQKQIESAAFFKININKATVDELEQIPKIGPVLAQRIVQYRTLNGNFSKPDDLAKVKGVGKQTLKIIKNYITLN